MLGKLTEGQIQTLFSKPRPSSRLVGLDATATSFSRDVFVAHFAALRVDTNAHLGGPQHRGATLSARESAPYTTSRGNSLFIQLAPAWEGTELPTLAASVQMTLTVARSQHAIYASCAAKSS